MKPAISVHNLSKQYRIGLPPGLGNNLTENLRRQVRTAWDKVSRLVSPNKEFSKAESFWALKDVSFEVQPGEVVGIIGRNGAGKSTLLKILSQIVEPTSGHADIRGRMGSLLEVGTGFHQELTGRENIYLNGAILGMKREEITKKFDEIVAFAEVEKFLDTPVKRYSSGMYVRLAFAVAAHLEPEILVVDEVLAVGDATFQKRCISRMGEISRSGRTILLVSHQLSMLPNLCTKAILLDKGKCITDGSPESVIHQYTSQFNNSRTGAIALKNRKRTTSDCSALITKFSLSDVSGNTLNYLTTGKELVMNIEIEVFTAINAASVSASFNTLSGLKISTFWSKDLSLEYTLLPGIHLFHCTITDINIRPGNTLSINLWIGSSTTIDMVENALVIDVLPDPNSISPATSTDQGIVLCDYTWSHHKQ